MWESIIGGEVGVFDDSCAGTMAHSVFTQAIDLVESDSATHVGRSRSGRVRGGVTESAGKVRDCALNEASNGGEAGLLVGEAGEDEVLDVGRVGSGVGVRGEVGPM